MQLHHNDHGFEGCLPEKRIAMKIKSSPKMFEILSSGIYKDKILAVIREYCCNAYDAHITTGKRDIPFTVRMPNRFESTFAVTDYGTGVDPEMIGEIFWTYGESSKTNDNTTIGALGLGSKSAFAYTKSSFIVKNRWNGNEYTYFCFINENGEPEGSMVGQEPTTEGNGITVEFAVRPEDNQAFYDRFGRIFKYWSSVKPTIIGVEPSEVFVEDPVKIIEGNNWYLEAAVQGEKRRAAIAIMGNVQYPIDSESIPNLPKSLKIIADNPFVITFPLGAFEFASSREEMSYSEFTCNAVIARLEEVRTGLEASFKAKVFDASKNHIELFSNFAETFKEFRTTVATAESEQRDRYGYGLPVAEINNMYSQLLVGKDQDEEIFHLGRSFTIENLIDRRYVANLDHYQSFAMYVPSTRGRVSSRYHLQTSSFLTFALKQEMDSKVFNPLSNHVYKLDAGHKIIENHDWKSDVIATRQSKNGPTRFDLALRNMDSLEVDTSNTFLINANAKKLVFILNDVGSSGRDRFRALVESHRSLVDNQLGDAQLVFIDFNAKATTAAAVLDELNRTAVSKFVGSSVRSLSTLPDNRQPVAKVKIERGNLKLTVKTLKFEKIDDIDVGSAHFSDAEIYMKNVEGFSNVTGTFDQIMSISDLVTRKAVPYVVKRRIKDKFFDNTNTRNESLVNNLRLFNLAHQFDMFKDVLIDVNENRVMKAMDSNGKMVESVQVVKVKAMQVLVINEGMYEHLLKKGVKLVSFNAFLSDQIIVMNNKEKFTEEVRRLVTMSKVSHLKGMYAGLQAQDHRQPVADVTNGWNVANSLFKKLFCEYMELRQHGSNFASSFAKLAIMNMLSISTSHVNYNDEAAKINSEIDVHYPMLSISNYNNMYDTTKAAKLIAYIEMMDKLLAQAVKSTEEEFHEEAHIW